MVNQPSIMDPDPYCSWLTIKQLRMYCRYKNNKPPVITIFIACMAKYCHTSYKNGDDWGMVYCSCNDNTSVIA
jgi:hypothetical protein